MNNDKYVGISRPRVLIADSDKRALQVYESALNGTLGPRAVLSTEALRHPDTGSLSFSHEPAYELCFCSYGKEAIQAFTSAIDTDSPFSVAIFDDALSPGTDIVEFVEMARALDPMVNIVLVSNPPVSSANALAKRVSALNDVLYWEKPLKELEVRQFVRALTEKWLAERHLQITRTRVQQLLTTSPIVIYSRTPNEHSKLTYLSENVREHLGYDPDSFLSNTSHWIDNIHPNDRFQALNEIF
ncbi:MAG: PAS domain-containing protein, partial [Rhodospirillales bacterium]|nr:PAS domain-containing protein [Rhodospirillales bacterium]